MPSGERCDRVYASIEITQKEGECRHIIAMTPLFISVSNAQPSNNGLIESIP